IGHRQKKHSFSGIYGSVYVLDPEAGRRPGLMADYVNFIKLFQAVDLVTVVGGLQVEPSDADPEKKFFQMLLSILRNTDKSLWGFPGCSEDIQNMFKMVSIAEGLGEAPLQRPLIGTAVCPLSPLRFTEEHGDTIMTYAEQGQPIYLNSCIMCGASGPIGLMGTVTIMNAEILAGMVLTQLVRPGSPVVYVPGGTVADLKRGQYTGGGPESNLIVIAGLQMALDMYRLPTRVMGGLSDAKAVDYQAGAETMQNLMMPLMAGAHFINNALGNLDGQLTTSFEKFMLDVESVDRTLRVLRGIDGIDQDLSLDLIKEMGHKGDYLMHRSTFERYRDRWRPTLSNWDDYMRWQKAGAPSVVENAGKTYKEILAKAPESMLEPEIERDLRRFVDNVKPVGSSGH
ncbi:MAG: trimethylamine methyltransferase family protein, partial [Pseudomonadota bacterium]